MYVQHRGVNMALKKCYGIYQGFAIKLNDPECRGRIQCTIPEVLGSSISNWCEPISPVAFDDGGDFCLPLKNEAVWIFFIGGDVDRPVYFGGWWCENSAPIEDYDEATSTRIINYAGCTIKMQEDKIKIGISTAEDALTISEDGIVINGDLTVNGTITHN